MHDGFVICYYLPPKNTGVDRSPAKNNDHVDSLSPLLLPFFGLARSGGRRTSIGKVPVRHHHPCI